MKNKAMSIILICALLAGLVSMFGVGASAETGDVLTKLKSDDWIILVPEVYGGATILSISGNKVQTVYFDEDGEQPAKTYTYKKIDSNTLSFDDMVIKNTNSNNILSFYYTDAYVCGALVKDSAMDMNTNNYFAKSLRCTRWLSNYYSSKNSKSYIDVVKKSNYGFSNYYLNVFDGSKKTELYINEVSETIFRGCEGYTDSGSQSNISEIYVEKVNDSKVNVIIYFNNKNIVLETWTKIFPDIAPGAWYYNAVNYVNNKGYITGYENGRFGVTDSLKRQDFVVILARIAKADLSQYKNMTPKNSDVKKSAYYAAAVNWATSNNIVSGYANGKFGVNDPITREQICTILYKYKNSPSVSSIENIYNFDDWYNISSFAEIPVAWAIQKGVISGTQDGRIAPTKTASRAEIATIIMNMDKKGMFK
ncbi:MAG: S-layer homology domain-containing protein [Clostridia bacterium]|nr:S-layer homology domain-containing protein [Clostridia bacterium]